jgi:hypothetical protein
VADLAQQPDELMAEEKPKRKNAQPNALQDFFAKMGVLGELLGFLWRRKLYWLIPMMLTLFIFAIIIVLGSSSGIAPFIYTLW